MQGKIDIFGMTDQGRVRRRNEDQFLIADLTRSLRVHQSSLSAEQNETLFGGSHGQVMMVADGLGGHAAGDRASRITVQAMATYMLNTMPWLYRLDASSDEDHRDELKGALKQCEAELSVEANVHPSDAGMGTTLTMSYIIWPRMYVLHVGDSRCYLNRGGRLQQVTRDHTVRQQLIEAGVQNSDDASEGSLWADTLWNSVQAGSEATPDVLRVDLELGDTLLLCTDGLTKHLDDAAIQSVLGTNDRAEVQCRTLIQRAVEHGGSDNITAIVARVLDQHDAMDQVVQSAAVPGRPETLEGDSTLELPPLENTGIQPGDDTSLPGVLPPSGAVRDALRPVARLRH